MDAEGGIDSGAPVESAGSQLAASHPSKPVGLVGRRLNAMKLSRVLLVLSAVTVLASVAVRAAPSSRSAGPTLAELAWLSGHWGSEVEGERTEEVWLAPGGRIMLGMNRTVGKDGQAFFEYLRIEERKDELVYVASPLGRGTTEFPLADLGEGFVQFENPSHDFPKVIRYELTKSGELRARVSGDAGGKEQAQEWTWKKR
jgi:hypothetical protein